MSRYAVYVKVVVDVENAKDAREIVDSELEDVISFDEYDIQKIKKADVEDDDLEDGDEEADPDL